MRRTLRNLASGGSVRSERTSEVSDSRSREPENPAGSGLFPALSVAAGVVLVGLAVGKLVEAWGWADRSRPALNVFYFLSVEGLGPRVLCWFVVLAIAAVCFRWWPLEGRDWMFRPITIWGIALTATAVSWWGNLWAYARYPLSMDEYGAEFQARIFGSGRLAASIPDEWSDYVAALQPIFVTQMADGRWISDYLPIYALMRAASLTIAPSMLLNPLLSAASILCIAAIARRLWPDEPMAPATAALLLASSVQFLAYGASYYSMPAHLAFNLLWLLLYLRDDRWGWLGVATLAPLAMGLHQFVVHPLFAAPFLFRLVLRRRWFLVLGLGTVYAASLYGWMSWMSWARPDLTAAGVGSSWGIPMLRQWIDQALNLSMVVGWQSPVLSVLAIVALLRVRRSGAVQQDLAIGCAVLLAFYCFFSKNQGHGWGYRYFFPILGNLVLLAVFGFKELSGRVTLGRATSFVVAGVVGAMALQLPLHALHVRSFVGPFAEAKAQLRASEADVVVVDVTACWYAWDFVRNDPLFQEGPTLLGMQKLTRRQSEDLMTSTRLLVLDERLCRSVGLPTTQRTGPQVLPRVVAPGGL